jgi:hypothetical protein
MLNYVPIHEDALYIVNLVEKKAHVKVGREYFFVFCTKMGNLGQIIDVCYTKKPSRNDP